MRRERIEMNSSSVQQIKSLIGLDGKPNYGHLISVPEALDIANFRYFSTMDKECSSLAKYFHYKQFQFVSIFTPQYVLGIAIADIRYLGTSFCYLYDINSNQLIEESWLRPLGLGYSLTASPWKGKAQFNKGQVRFDIKDGQWRVRAKCKTFELDVLLDSTDAESPPLMVSSPTGYSGWTYTQKHNALKVRGEFLVGGEAQLMENCLGGYDFSAGFMRRETSWRWASISGESQGVTIGLNLAAGVNETGVTENVLWIGGKRCLLAGVMFDFDRQTPDSSWRIYDDQGRVDLTFQPINARTEKLNLWVLKSNFRQFIGYFSGVVKDEDGHEYALQQVMGLTEDHFAKW
ncbi:hypothetical protein VTH8203_01297 [Vibrio thalassae]|uniref:DUF2804 domain-containing protein n=2 Tax=Vibrio thalassae TaxID=1243014 RepID=A0A240EG88_9VIBR|nr:hypothetical protein VTH8203_01297 [Vibrio thalassae]